MVISSSMTTETVVIPVNQTLMKEIVSRKNTNDFIVVLMIQYKKYDNETDGMIKNANNKYKKSSYE